MMRKSRGQNVCYRQLLMWATHRPGLRAHAYTRKHKTYRTCEGKAKHACTWSAIHFRTLGQGYKRKTWRRSCSSGWHGARAAASPFRSERTQANVWLPREQGQNRQQAFHELVRGPGNGHGRRVDHDTCARAFEKASHAFRAVHFDNGVPRARVLGPR